MEGHACDNILVLSADMENLTRLGQKAVNTEHGRFKYSYILINISINIIIPIRIRMSDRLH